MGNQYAKNHGLDKLQSQLEEAQKACNAIDGELGSVHFNPEKPESIEAASSLGKNLLMSGLVLTLKTPSLRR